MMLWLTALSSATENEESANAGKNVKLIIDK